MNAVILVGGGGTRLRPLTYALPKPLIPVLNQPLIARLISNLQRHGVDHVVLAASASERRIENALGDGSVARRQARATPTRPSRSAPASP